MATLKVTNIKNESFAGDQLYLKTDGKIGIGTTSPLVPLQVKGSGSNGQIFLGGSGAYAQLYADNDGVLILSADHTNSAANSYFAISIDTSEKFRIKSDGNVGIGITNPGYNLDIKDGTSARVAIDCSTGSDAAIIMDGINADFAGSDYYSIKAQSTGEFAIFKASTERLRIASDGNIEVGGNLKTNNLPGRNLVINGAMKIAQRGTSATAEGYKTVDRFIYDAGGEDETITQAQVDVASGTTPYTLGFRKAWKLTNGNQTGGAGASDYVQPQYRFEAQDIANSGWNYTSSSSFITLSFWVKSSVAGDYTLNLETLDGTAYRYLMEYTLSADTWTKVTKTIPGNSNLTFNNDIGHGATIMLYPYLGSTYVQADQENNWYASSNSKYGTTSTTSWWTTNDATWEITGVQLEIGSIATEYEHRSYSDELARCLRYYWKDKATNAYHIFTTGASYGDENVYGHVDFPVPMRSSGSDISLGYSQFSDFEILQSNLQKTPTSFLLSDRINQYGGQLFYKDGTGALTTGFASFLRAGNNTDAYLSYDCEL